MAWDGGEMNCLMVIFGATGDLTSRKLVPALYHLEVKELLPEAFGVVAVARKAYSTDQYLTHIRQKSEEHTHEIFEDAIWSKLANRFHYQPLEFDQEDQYGSLKKKLDTLEKKLESEGNRLFYMAVSPEYFGTIVQHLENQSLIDRKHGWQRMMIEKPFGRDAASARELNQTLRKVFEEEELFRIDHYLVKEMVQNLMTIRAANQIFEPTWNKDHIDHVQIVSAEMEGVGTRGAYYDQAGALRDMLQNHMLQMLALTAMEMPNFLTAEKLRAEKVRILRSLIPLAPETMENRLVLGQYEGYHNEPKVAPESTTETFAALKVFLDHPRWEGVPFFLITGKALAEKTAGIMIQYKLPMGSWSLRQTQQQLAPNRLIIQIQPQEGVVLTFNSKEPGTMDQLMTVNMDFCQNCLAGTNTPEAYEKLLLDAMKGDQSSFTHWDEVEASWIWIDHLTSWAAAHPEAVKSYPKGSQGPVYEERLKHASAWEEKEENQ
ncbi:glucose-6-phosphate dehydrogenase [Anoxynatronum buryatiense]|uniref:Glucose-6-phosphate 1-dehydrogenase n=1 Tax=Anoxynatronum buryatiense TaxID=489973 RepID=A0AA45WXY1_9CLOT|nr:glucose-6-phosphate dehydrogenase [Anoxynatronum buryatiense]SMP66311.1 glucose-6-phosphate 1-dehydrogenase [Anoxynatronum buryatiense]